MRCELVAVLITEEQSRSSVPWSSNSLEEPCRVALLECREVSAAPALLYLHGLASSPKGRKRELLGRRFEAEGWKVVAPDLNVPSFRELSFAEMCAEAFVTCVEARSEEHTSE